jgi:hypothetical protein
MCEISFDYDTQGASASSSGSHSSYDSSTPDAIYNLLTTKIAPSVKTKQHVDRTDITRVGPLYDLRTTQTYPASGKIEIILTQQSDSANAVVESFWEWTVACGEKCSGDSNTLTSILDDLYGWTTIGNFKIFGVASTAIALGTAITGC